MKKIILILFLMMLLVPSVYASPIILSSNASPLKIFKCGASIITANFSDDSIVNLTANFNGQSVLLHGFLYNPTESLTMTWIASGQWQGIYGNDQTLLWGLRQVSFTDELGNNYTTNATLFVYSDNCVGTNKTNYTQIPNGLGKYTAKLYNGQFSFLGSSFETSIIGWALFPWIEIWGYLFYLLIIFTICIVIYMKTQNIVQPLSIGVFLLLIFASTSVIDTQYKQWILFILAIAITALYYRVFVRD
jgi:hypothetical protein